VIKKREGEFEKIVPDTLKWEVNGRKIYNKGYKRHLNAGHKKYIAHKGVVH